MTHHRGVTKEGQVVELFPNQVNMIKRLLHHEALSVWTGGRGSGRSTALNTAVMLDKHLPGCPRREFVDVQEVCLCED